MIKVKDLIKKLKELDQDAVVVVASDNFEMNNATIPARGINVYKGKIESQRFRDAFDGESYSSDVIRYDAKGDTTFVQVH